MGSIPTCFFWLKTWDFPQQQLHSHELCGFQYSIPTSAAPKKPSVVSHVEPTSHSANLNNVENEAKAVKYLNAAYWNAWTPQKSIEGWNQWTQ